MAPTLASRSGHGRPKLDKGLGALLRGIPRTAAEQLFARRRPRSLYVHWDTDERGRRELHIRLDR